MVPACEKVLTVFTYLKMWGQHNAIETIKTDDKLLCLMLPVNSNTRFAKSTVTQGLPNTCTCQVVSDVQLHCFVSTQNPNLPINQITYISWQVWHAWLKQQENGRTNLSNKEHLHDQGFTLTFQQLTSLVSCYIDYGVFILSIRKKEFKSLLS